MKQRKKVIIAGICVILPAVFIILAVVARMRYQETENAPSRMLAKKMEEEAQVLDFDVTISAHKIEEGQFYPWLYGRLQKLEESFLEEEIVCYMDAQTSADGLARVEIGNPYGSDVHYLYLLYDNTVYEICGNTKQGEWGSWLYNVFVREDFFMGATHIAGTVLKNEAFDFTYDEEKAGLTTIAVYAFGSYETDAAFYENEEGEFVLVSKSISGGEEQTEETFVRKREEFSVAEGGREQLFCLLEEYPDADAYSVYKPVSSKAQGHFCTMLTENGIAHCFFYYEGEYYEIVSKQSGGGKAVKQYKIIADLKLYDSAMCREWIKREDGSSCWLAPEEESYCLWQNVGEEKSLLLQISLYRHTSSEGKRYQVEVYWEGEEKPIQSFLTEAAAKGSDLSKDFNKDGILDMLESQTPFSFWDLNADGYLDFHYISKSRPQKYFHYFWSPSGQKFVRGPEELEQYLKCYINNREERKFKVVKEAGRWEVSSSIYQWSGELDYKLAGTFHVVRPERKNAFLVHMEKEDNGEEKIFMDYEYDMEEYPYYVYDNFFMEFFNQEQFWVKTIQSNESGKHYQLSYGREDLSDYELETSDDGAVSEGDLWVLDESTQLIKRLTWRETASYREIQWEDGSFKQEFIIYYEDGSEKRWTLEEILKDPAKEIYDRSMQIDYTVKESPIDTIKYDIQTDRQYKDAYYKVVSNQIPVRGTKSEKIYLKRYFDDYVKETTDEEYLKDLIKSTLFYYMDFDGDGMPELVMDIMHGGGLHILKYLPEEDEVEFFIAYPRMPYYNLLGAGQLCYHHPGLANKDMWGYDVVDENGQTESVAFFIEDFNYVHPDDGSWQGTYWVDLYDELGMVQVDEESYKEITKNFFEAVKNAPSEMSFEEIFGEY